MNKTIKACQNCGKAFGGSAGQHYCPECAKKKKLDTVIRLRTCQDCGVEFEGGPRARRCPVCAAMAIKNYKQKKAARPLGSMDKCAVCGKEYIVTSGRQKYCSKKCQRIGVLSWQREHKKGYSKTSGQNEKKKQRRNMQEKICVYCLRPFRTNTASNLCSEYCRNEQRKLNYCRADIKRGMKRNMQ